MSAWVARQVGSEDWTVQHADRPGLFLVEEVEARRLAAVPTPLPLSWVCCECVAAGLTQPPDPTKFRRTDGLCGPHMDLMRVGLWVMVAARVAR